jgi:hypothetical protein
VPREPRDDAQPDPDASSDGDGSWTEDPITADPDQDRSVDAVIEQGDGV